MGDEEERGSMQLMDDDSDDDEKVEAEDARALKKAKRGAARAAKRALRKIASRTRSDSDSDSSSESDEQLVAPVDGEGDDDDDIDKSAAKNKRGTCASIAKLRSPKSPDTESRKSSNDGEDSASPLLANSDLEVVDLEKESGGEDD